LTLLLSIDKVKRDQPLISFHPSRQSAMSRKGEAASLKELKTYRVQIDRLDLHILKLINERADLAAKIGKVKTETNNSVFSPAREEEVITNVLAANRGPLPEVTVRAIYREIISGSRALQKIDKVAFLGPEYSFSHLAALHRFGRAAEFMGVTNIAAVFEEVNR
jgi:chorismate mutase/prephenate dehydratase